jgi:hypothetical protein
MIYILQQGVPMKIKKKPLQTRTERGVVGSGLDRIKIKIIILFFWIIINLSPKIIRF